MPNVQGRLDHSAVDLKRKRLFVAALGDNQNTVEVINLKSGKRVASIPGQSKPQGVFYSSDLAKLFVANGTDGTCKIFDANTLKLIDSLAIGPTRTTSVMIPSRNTFMWVSATRNRELFR